MIPEAENDRFATARPLPEWSTLKRFAAVFLVTIALTVMSGPFLDPAARGNLFTLSWCVALVFFICGFIAQIRFNRAYFRYWTAKGFTKDRVNEEYYRMFTNRRRNRP